MPDGIDGAQRHAEVGDRREDGYPSESDATDSDAPQRPLAEAQVDAAEHAQKFIGNRDYYEVMEPRFIVDIYAHGPGDHGVFDFGRYVDGSTGTVFIELTPTGEGDEDTDCLYRLAFVNIHVECRKTQLKLEEHRNGDWGEVGAAVTRLEVQV